MATNLVPKPNIVSPIWAHFGFEPDDKGQAGEFGRGNLRIVEEKYPSREEIPLI